MKKIEIIWREILFQTIEKGERQFTQKCVAAKFGFSTSTVFQALKAPRKMGAVRVTGRNFYLEDPEKLLYHWASVRTLASDFLLQTRVDLQIDEIEGLAPAESVYGAYSAARRLLQEAPADYDKVYLYLEDIDQVKKRYNLNANFSKRNSRPNLIVLKSDKFLANYGQVTSLAQTFVDLWNLSDWYAKEFVRKLKEKIDGLL